MTRILSPHLTAPRTNRDRAFAASKRDRLFAPHVAPLNRLVEELVANGRPAPWVDPDGGGIHSRILFLLESPGPMASSAHGSGFISVDNDDPTAERCWRLGADAGLARDTYASWNLVPWYVSSTRKNQNAGPRDATEAAPWLRKFVSLLPELRVVVLMGAFAQKQWPKAKLDRPGLHVLATRHPGNLTRVSCPGFENEILATMREAARLA